MPELVWLASADTDLNNIADRISEDNIDAAIALYLRVKELSRGLLEHPYIGRTGKVQGTRERVVTGTKYIIVYQLTMHKIEIVKILHGSQAYP